MVKWIVAAVAALIAGAAIAHDGVPLQYEAMCCSHECAETDDSAERVSDFAFRLRRSREEVWPGWTFYSTNGKTIICRYPDGRIRCLFIPPQIT
jgi:hypothetical protein